MAKPKSDKPRAERKRKVAAPSLAPINDADRKVIFFQHKRKLAPLYANLRAAQNAVKNALAVAKSEGVSKKQLDIGFALDDDAGELTQDKAVKTILEVADWMGSPIGAQLPLPLLGADKTDKFFKDGERAAMKGDGRKPPGHVSQIGDVDRWYAGFDAGAKAVDAISRVGRGAEAKADFVSTIGG